MSHFGGDVLRQPASLVVATRGTVRQAQDAMGSHGRGEEVYTQNVTDGLRVRRPREQPEGIEGDEAAEDGDERTRRHHLTPDAWQLAQTRFVLHHFLIVGQVRLTPQLVALVAWTLTRDDGRADNPDSLIDLPDYQAPVRAQGGFVDGLEQSRGRGVEAGDDAVDAAEQVFNLLGRREVGRLNRHLHATVAPCDLRGERLGPRLTCILCVKQGAGARVLGRRLRGVEQLQTTHAGRSQGVRGVRADGTRAQEQHARFAERLLNRLPVDAHAREELSLIVVELLLLPADGLLLLLFM